MTRHLLLLDHELHSKFASDSVVEAAELVTSEISLEVARIEVICQVENLDPTLNR